MRDNRKPAKEARYRAARSRSRIRLVSFSAGILLFLVIAVALLLNGSGDVTVSSHATATPEASVEKVSTVSQMKTPEPTLLQAPTPTPVITVEPTLKPLPVPSITTPTPVSVKLNVKDKISMVAGDTGKLRAKLDPPNSSAVLTWRSSNTKVIKVNQKGQVKAVGSGTAEVSLWINNDDEAKAIVSIKVEKKITYVWIPRTGEKYHSSSRCSNMKNPKKVSLSYAISHGYTKCSKCW